MTKRVAKIGIIVSITLMVGVCYYLINNPQVQRAVRHWKMSHLDDYTRVQLVWKYSGMLHSGMTRDEVRDVFGPPDNQDSEYIWYWCCDKELRSKYKTWRELSEHCEGQFHLFYPSGALASPSPFKNVVCPPWSTYLQQVIGRGEGEKGIKLTESLLGPDPHGERLLIGFKPIDARNLDAGPLTITAGQE